jgi:hypothetical protein
VSGIVLLKGSRMPSASETLFRSIRPSFMMVTVVLLFNGLCPYLGLKTQTSFSMFSNLRTEGNETNHLFIPAGSQPFGFQDDVVEITGTTAPSPLSDWAARREVVPWYEFRARASEHPEASVSYVRNGDLHEVALIGDDPEIGETPFARKFLHFRTVPKEGPMGCTH